MSTDSKQRFGKNDRYRSVNAPSSGERTRDVRSPTYLILEKFSSLSAGVLRNSAAANAIKASQGGSSSVKADFFLFPPSPFLLPHERCAPKRVAAAGAISRVMQINPDNLSQFKPGIFVRL